MNKTGMGGFKDNPGNINRNGQPIDETWRAILNEYLQSNLIKLVYRLNGKEKVLEIEVEEPSNFKRLISARQIIKAISDGDLKSAEWIAQRTEPELLPESTDLSLVDKKDLFELSKLEKRINEILRKYRNKPDGKN